MATHLKNRYYALVALGLIIVDQVFVTLVWNQAIPLQILSNRWLPLPVTITATLAVAGLLVLWRVLEKKSRLGLAFMLAGALSNYLTAARYGQVVDFFPFFSTKNNIADYLVVIGGIMVALTELKARFGKSTS